MSGIPAPLRPVDAKPRPAVLVVDDDPAVREAFRLILDDDYEVLEAPDGARTLELVGATPLDLVLLDVRLPDMDGIGVLERIKGLDEQVEVILVTAVSEVRTAVAAMKLGAFHYVTKPFDEDEVLALVRRAAERRTLGREMAYLRAEVRRQQEEGELIGRHPAMRRLQQLIASVARTRVTVLLVGESGTGKELVARAIHREGLTRDGPFVPVNVAAIPETLLESELFGHEKGAFTGAVQKKLGKFELAHGGTLFLDEIATLRPELQVKLLRALQEREIERIGGTQRIRVDVRVMAATNTDPRRAIETGALREDLYYRLNVVQLTVPPLRARRDDIPLLVEHFVRRYSRELRKAVTGVAPAALQVLEAYPWPGNVRELQNAIERAVALGAGPEIELGDLPLDLLLYQAAGAEGDAEPVSLKEARDQFERQLIVRTLARVGGSQAEAARVLGLPRTSLRERMQALGLLGPGGDPGKGAARARAPG
jgi:DNA-binding NtrC family response regulator